MRTIITSAIVAVASEGLLCAAFALFGGFSFTRSEDTNLLGLVTVFLHLPGLSLASALFGPFLGRAGIAVAILTSALQFFLFAWGVLAIRNTMRRPSNVA